MNRDDLAGLIPAIITISLILVKLFVGLMVLIAILLLVVLPAQKEGTGLVSQDSNQLMPTIAPEDAALANSEWSGVITQKTISPESTPVILPTILPTVLPTEFKVAESQDTSPNSSSLSANLLIGSPLGSFQNGDLQELISQDFLAPPPGEDTGHHGVDFAFWNRGNKPILGEPILAVFPGKVTMADTDEVPPYGHVLIIETPLNDVPQALVQFIKIPAQPIGTMINNKLNCPDSSLDAWNSSDKSLYTLYAHMISSPLVSTGESVLMGQTIGYVGNSGYSSAPHLHLEMRIGPSGATFSNMGHYDPITTEEERHNYCNWRVSGVFQMFDPMDLYKASLVLN